MFHLRALVRFAFLALVASGCTTTEIIYRDREPFNAPPDAASGLLGYYNVSTKQTTCGNCHVGHQTRWEETKHAMAHQTLKNINTAPTATCWGCHTVTERGNALTTAAGWNVKSDSAYQDVQCESCHGPGAEHVQNPSNRAKIPLRATAVPTTRLLTSGRRARTASPRSPPAAVPARATTGGRPSSRGA
jgi:hypothetical protein